MASKLNNLSELQQVLGDNNIRNEGALAFASQFNVSQLLKPFSSAKIKGYLISTLIAALCLYRLSGKSIWAMQRLGNKSIFDGDENSFYRLLNNQMVNWCGILVSFSCRFLALIEKNCEPNQSKLEVAVNMIKRAVKNGFVASYVLMDSWFVNDYSKNCPAATSRLSWRLSLGMISAAATQPCWLTSI